MKTVIEKARPGKVRYNCDWCGKEIENSNSCAEATIKLSFMLEKSAETTTEREQREFCCNEHMNAWIKQYRSNRTML